jgi:hypothetical protein
VALQYNMRYNQWRARYPGVPYDAAWFNEVIAQAWEDFVTDGGTEELIVKAFCKTRIYPLVDVLDEGTELTDADKRNAKLACIFATDERDQATLKIHSDADIAKATVSVVLEKCRTHVMHHIANNNSIYSYVAFIRCRCRR